MAAIRTAGIGGAANRAAGVGRAVNRGGIGTAAQGGAAGGRSAAGRDFDFVVVGAGITASVMASVALARKLAAPGRVAIVAEQPAPPAAASSTAESDWGLRVFALSRASQRLLKICGAWQLLPPQKKCAYERMCVWERSVDEPHGAGSLTFDCAELGEPNLGFIVEGDALQTQCRNAAMAAGVVFIEAGIEGIAVADADVRIRLNDGRELQSQLLIAADGADSRARALLGIETAGHAYHQDALVAHVRTAKPHRSTAWQRFLPTGPLAFLPLPDGRSSIVWSAARAEAARLRLLDPVAFGAALAAASGEVLGSCELTTPVGSFPLKLQYALEYARPRAVLVGDAAHAVHPLAGQGLNLGLLDCAALAEVLSGDLRSPGSRRFFGEFKQLRRYERWRKAENLLAATAMDGLERLFSSGNPALSGVRVAGLGAVGRMPFIKRRLALRALGLRGDLPAFLTAEPDSGTG
jgi:2-octaprenylphenol hydroxylase